MSRLRRARRDDRGFTIIEVMAAMMVSLIVIGAAATGFVRNNDASLSSQREGQLVSVAQQQIESIRTTVSRYGFSTLALKSKPAQPTDCSGQCTTATLPTSPTDPNDFILGWSGSTPSYLIEQNYNSTATGEVTSVPSTGEPLEIDTTNGQVIQKSTGVAVGSGTATVYRYVTQATVPCNSGSVGSGGLGVACSADDVRRVIVAVLMDNPNGSKAIGPNAPVYMSTIFSNPIPSNQPNSASGLRLGLNIG
jgi:prepilin-type N-terminal cleavage/methylation domain-containing protein